MKETEGQDNGQTPLPEDHGNKRFGVRRLDIIPLMVGSKKGGSGDTSSVTLVRTATSTVVIDSGSVSVRDELLENIEDKDINIEKVNVLVTTRADPLHIGNDSLFVHALQHIRGEEWGSVKDGMLRRIAINNDYHWIDRHLKLVSLPFPSPGTLALLVHLPTSEELLEPNTRAYAGKVVAITGFAVNSGQDEQVKRAIQNANEEKTDPGSIGRISTMEDLFRRCDHVIPAYGPVFEVNSPKKG